jgi:hypothetical protein
MRLKGTEKGMERRNNKEVKNEAWYLKGTFKNLLP